MQNFKQKSNKLPFWQYVSVVVLALGVLIAAIFCYVPSKTEVKADELETTFQTSRFSVYMPKMNTMTKGASHVLVSTTPAGLRNITLSFSLEKVGNTQPNISYWFKYTFYDGFAPDEGFPISVYGGNTITMTFCDGDELELIPYNSPSYPSGAIQYFYYYLVYGEPSTMYYAVIPMWLRIQMNFDTSTITSYSYETLRAVPAGLSYVLSQYPSLIQYKFYDKNDYEFTLIFPYGVYGENSYNVAELPFRRYYYSFGLDNAAQESYQNGFNTGLSQGITEGKQQGLQEGYTSGFADGKSQGYASGFQEGAASASNYTFFGLISAVVDAPIQAITGLFDFEILGFNVQNFMFSLLTVCVIITIIKVVT